MQKPSAQELPATADVLARVYIDAIATAEGVKVKSMFKSHRDDIVDEFLEGLEAADDADSPHLRVDLLLAAVLGARMIASEPDLAHRLRHQGPVVIVKTHTSELVDQLSDIFGDCAIAARTSRKLIVARDGTDRTHHADRGGREVASALNNRWPVIGIAPNPAKQLPSMLTRMAQFELSLPAIDDWAIKLVLEALTGKAYDGSVDPAVIRNADVTDYALAFHRAFTPEECLTRLSDLVKKKRTMDIDGPTLEQLAGYGEAKTWGLELVADLDAYRRGEVSWADFDHRGLLLSGPPGTGKTSYAKALAKTAGVPLISTSVADWNAATYLSGTLQAIRDVFGKAQQAAPAILLIDELDGISDRSTLKGDYVEYWTQIVNLLLECLAGVEARPGVVVIAATNYPDKIDPAVLRAGRLDHHIALAKPDVTALEAIFRFHLGDESFPTSGLISVALEARGATGADVEAWVRRAKASARRAGRDLALDDLRTQVAGEKTMPQALRRRISVHEAGHVVVSRILGAGKLQEVGIGRNSGFTLVLGLGQADCCEADLDNSIAFFLAGRAAEKIILGTVGVGSGGAPESDLALATGTAMKAEAQLGFGTLGLQYVPNGQLGYGWLGPQLSGSISQRLDRGMAKAEDIISRHIELIEAIAEALDRHGYLSANEVDDIVLPAVASVIKTVEAAE